MRLVKTPRVLPLLFPWGEWRETVDEKVIYLTFDDGPVPEATPFVIDLLKAWNARATFFCVGANAGRHPSLLQDLLSGGHRLGNHTFDHLDGWKTSAEEYLENISRCAAVVSSKLFRPPYGKINLRAIAEIRLHYRVVFWDVVSYDFDASFRPEECIAQTAQAARPGSIVVFHDSLKAFSTLKTVLPALLERWTLEGFQFKAL